VGFGLQAPAAVPVELHASRRRLFRLSHLLGEEGICLERPAPFELGARVELRLILPGSDEPIALRARVEALDDAEERAEKGGRGLRFLEPPHEARRALRTYVAQRLGLPTLL
jgi:hypothetical protein